MKIISEASVKQSFFFFFQLNASSSSLWLDATASYAILSLIQKIPTFRIYLSFQDIMMKIISFSQQGSRAICILAANGTISNVTLRQPNSSGGTLTYEVRAQNTRFFLFF